MKITFLLFTIAFMASSCATAGKMNRVSIGQTKAQVISELGDPDTTQADGGFETMVYLKYATAGDAWYGNNTKYVVIFKNGVVDKYGPYNEFSQLKARKVIIESSHPVSPAVVAE